MKICLYSALANETDTEAEEVTGWTKNWVHERCGRNGSKDPGSVGPTGREVQGDERAGLRSDDPFRVPALNLPSADESTAFSISLFHSQGITFRNVYPAPINKNLFQNARACSKVQNVQVLAHQGKTPAFSTDEVDAAAWTHPGSHVQWVGLEFSRGRRKVISADAHDQAQGRLGMMFFGAAQAAKPRKLRAHRRLLRSLGRPSSKVVRTLRK